jgi:hypothetical protein
LILKSAIIKKIIRFGVAGGWEKRKMKKRKEKEAKRSKGKT